MLYLYNLLIPVVIGLVFLPFWYIKDFTLLPGLQILANVVLLPIILVIMDSILFLRGKVGSYFILYLIIPFACLIGQLFSYFNWGISTGNLMRPDNETLMLAKYLVIIAIGISWFLLAIAHIFLKGK
jgi:hypothetical protein